MSKFVGKFRHRDFLMDEDDYEYSKNYSKPKKKKSEDFELKKLRMQDYEDRNYGYDRNDYKKSKKLAKL